MINNVTKCFQAQQIEEPRELMIDLMLDAGSAITVTYDL